MIYTELTVKAMNIAYEAHNGQYDRGGVPYVFHPYHLAEQMDDEYSTCVALLHDVVEDTDLTLEDLAKDFPMEVVDAVGVLSRDMNLTYFDYVRTVKANPISTKVKLADLNHNLDQSRIPLQKRSARTKELKERYLYSIKILNGEVE